MLFLVVLDSCEDPKPVAGGFEDASKYTIYNYLLVNKEEFSDFLAILEAGGIDNTLNNYNPNGDGYTLFLPGNEAMDKFISSTDGISSLDDILENPEFVAAFSAAYSA